MCGIVGYVGSSAPTSRPQDSVLTGLSRLEYRGYDSAGLALASPDLELLAVAKKTGKLKNLQAALDAVPLGPATAAIGHTRWATHGSPIDANAHPHTALGGKLALVHNGIIENFVQLRGELETEGITFVSETDSEVAAHLLGRAYTQTGDLTLAMRQVAGMLKGSFTLVAVHADFPDRVVAARHDSPLVVGVGQGEKFLGSDVAAFIDYTRNALELGQDQVVTMTKDLVTVTDFAGNPVEPRSFTVDWDVSAAQKGGFSSFMTKEIADQPQAVADTLTGRLTAAGDMKLDDLRISEDVLRQIDKIVVIACGTAAYAGHVAKYAIEHWCRIPVEVELAHEFRYRDPILTPRTLVVAISQSGETMDTLMAVRHAREQGARVIAIVNTHGSAIARESDAVLYTHAGPEVAVASTKAFVSQITATYVLGLYLAQLRGNMFRDEVAGIFEQLRQMPGKIAQVLNNQEAILDVARQMADATSVLFLGRHVGYPIALEGALKLKELAYIHAEGFAAGELKHGPIALIDQGQPVVIVVPSPRGRSVLHAKVISNIQEIRARGAHTIVIAEEGDRAVVEFADQVFFVPQCPTLMSPLLTVLPLQIFAAELARVKGLDVDQPRNLAKSVTVE